MGINFIGYKRGGNYNLNVIRRHKLHSDSGALTISDVKFIQSLGYTVLSRHSNGSTKKKKTRGAKSKIKSKTNE